MSEDVFNLTRRTVATRKTYANVVEELEQRAPVADISRINELAKSQLSEAELRAAIERMIGSSGFMMLAKIEHSVLLQRFGRERSSVQYAIGNPFIAHAVSDAAPAACLYAPLLLAVFEQPDEGVTYISYDSPASLMGSFNSKEASKIGALLEDKLQALVAACQ
jgi:uncharacterized protein (DUF302 family)